LARIILSHALLESIRFVMSRKERRDIYGLINNDDGHRDRYRSQPGADILDHIALSPALFGAGGSAQRVLDDLCAEFRC
jgi:hypothetical protein